MATIATPEHHERVAKITFSSVYPHYVDKVVKKGRTEEELHTVLEWLTGYDKAQIDQRIAEKVDMKGFFADAKIHPNAPLIKGVICGYRIEDLDNELTRQVRYMDKLVDELAKGKKMEKILREA